jgi:3-dehydroquinate synthase
MIDSLTIRSGTHDYQIDFVEDYRQVWHRESDASWHTVVDERLLELYPDLETFLPQERRFVVPACEETKTLEFSQRLIGQLIAANIRKNSVLIAFGGGVIQDITAFIASIMFRGIEWRFFPTTLLAQADSCIGSKTSINFQGYKNLLGNFYPPSRIYLDLKFLRSLPKLEIRSGIGEILHFFLYADSPLTKPLMEQYHNLIEEPGLLKDYVMESLKIKKAVVEIDERDQGIRNLFNYGHTFGHALEKVSRYQVPHGQAVTFGMDMANYISMRLGLMAAEQFRDLHQLLKMNLPVYVLDPGTLTEYMQALAKDKKNVSSHLTCILAEGPGRLVKKEIPLDDRLRGIMETYLRQEFFPNFHAME